MEDKTEEDDKLKTPVIDESLVENKSHMDIEIPIENKSTENLKVDLKEEKVEIEIDDYKNYNLRKTKPKTDFYNEKEETKNLKRKKKTTQKTVNTDLYGSKIYSCDICNEYFFNELGRNCHRNTHFKSDDNKYTCEICKNEFQTNILLIKHKEIHKDETYLCKKCKLAFSNHRLYLTHILTHIKNPPFNCFECQYQFTKRNSLRAHLSSHYEEVERECPICKKSVALRSLSNHISEHNTVQCVECNKTIKKAMYKYHMAIHTGYKPFQCLYCGKGFISASILKIHTRIHTDTRPYKCESCDRSFRQQVDFQRHIASKHTTERFECDTCGKKYKSKQSLITHFREHSNYKPYKCPQCPKAFIVSTLLKSHLYIRHIKEKRLRCEVCDVQLLTKNAVRKHNLTKKHLRMVNKSKSETQMCLTSVEE